MLGVWDDTRQYDSKRYTRNQTQAVLRSIGVTIDSETENDSLCFCLFHKNNHTPSFSVSLTKGTYVCFSPSCGVSGSLVNLVMRLTGRDAFAAMRLIMKKAGETEQAFSQELEASMVNQLPFVEFSKTVLDNLRANFVANERPQQYMQGRKFTLDTMADFEVGYSAKKDMICVPMHDPTGMPIGLIGRSIEGKVFNNSVNLPKSRTIWNINGARAASDTIILVEASFDAMRIHQSGFPNVGALLGGTLSKEQIHLLDKYFNKIIIMTDNDTKKFNDNGKCAKCRKRNLNMCSGHQPGLDLGNSIAGALHRKSIYWASYEFGIRFPNGAKDPGEISDDEIKTCIRNSVPHFEFSTWK
jgi:DNA primase